MGKSKMLSCRFVLVVGCWAGLLAGYGPAAEWFVAQNGQIPDPLGNYTSWTTAASNIQQAVNVAGVNDTVWVGPGHYTVPPNPVVQDGVNVVHTDKPLHLRAAGPREDTVIDGEGINRCVYWVSDATTNRFILEGFTLTNGYGNRGAGVFLGPATGNSWTGMVVNCFFVDNTTHGDGGAIFALSTHDDRRMGLIVSNSVFRANETLTGGGGAI